MKNICLKEHYVKHFWYGGIGLNQSLLFQSQQVSLCKWNVKHYKQCLTIFETANIYTFIINEHLIKNNITNPLNP